MKPKIRLRSLGVAVIDGFLEDPESYRAFALRGQFESFKFETCTFHGISPVLQGSAVLRDPVVPTKLQSTFLARPTLSFFRKSPRGQTEPHFIHTDADMGRWSAILYLNPDAPAEDGTSFWTHAATGEIGNPAPHLRSEEGQTTDGWNLRMTIAAKFNRMLVFPSTHYHSRAIVDNWGSGDESRLTQVTFGEDQS